MQVYRKALLALLAGYVVTQLLSQGYEWSVLICTALLGAPLVLRMLSREAVGPLELSIAFFSVQYGWARFLPTEKLGLRWSQDADMKANATSVVFAASALLAYSALRKRNGLHDPSSAGWFGGFSLDHPGYRITVLLIVIHVFWPHQLGLGVVSDLCGYGAAYSAYWSVKSYRGPAVGRVLRMMVALGVTAYYLRSGLLADFARLVLVWLLMPARGAKRVTGPLRVILFMATMVSGAGLLIVLQGIKAQYRETVWYGPDEVTSIEVAAQLARDQEYGGEYGLEVVESIAERLEGHSLLVHIIEWVGDSHRGYGSWSWPFIGWIPRFIWPGKPMYVVGNEWGRASGALDWNDRKTSFNLSPILEGYWNGGIQGVALAGVLWVALVASVLAITGFATWHPFLASIRAGLLHVFLWPESDIGATGTYCVQGIIFLYITHRFLRSGTRTSVREGTQTLVLDRGAKASSMATPNNGRGRATQPR